MKSRESLGELARRALGGAILDGMIRAHHERMCRYQSAIASLNRLRQEAERAATHCECGADVRDWAAELDHRPMCHACLIRALQDGSAAKT